MSAILNPTKTGNDKTWDVSACLDNKPNGLLQVSVWKNFFFIKLNENQIQVTRVPFYFLWLLFGDKLPPACSAADWHEDPSSS